MKNVTIETLTPVHVGSGQEYQPGFEYLYFADEKKMAILDAHKVLSILGEEYLHQWIECMDNNESILPLLKKRMPGLSANNVALREINAPQMDEKPVRAQIRNDSVGAYLPGSSLKGALRTAIFTTLLLDHKTLGEQQGDLGELKGNRFRWSDKKLMGELLGRNPNSDLLRLLQVGDFQFPETRIFKSQVVNTMKNRWEIKKSLTQYIEAIPANKKATGRIRINDLQKTLMENNQSRLNYTERLTYDELTSICNQHTLKLIESEIDYWTSKNNPEALGDYLDHCEEIRDAIINCDNNTCIIRLGWGVGFRTMTGDWHGKVMHNDDYDNLIEDIRRNYSADIIFPKTTKILDGGQPLGFLKLHFTDPANT